MSTKGTWRKNLLGLITALILIAVGCRLFFHKYIYDEGTAANLSDLQKVYARAGFQSAYTNTLLQTLPFDGQIDWRLLFIAEPAIYLKGQIKTNALPQFANHLSSNFIIWTGVTKDGHSVSEESWPRAELYPDVTWTNITFQVREPPGVAIDGQITWPSGSITVQTH